MKYTLSDNQNLQRRHLSHWVKWLVGVFSKLELDSGGQFVSDRLEDGLECDWGGGGIVTKNRRTEFPLTIALSWTLAPALVKILEVRLTISDALRLLGTLSLRGHLMKPHF